MVNDKSIKISFWNYVNSGVFNKEQVKIWKELGFNLPMSFLYEDGVSDKRDMLDILDECQKLGLKLIVCDDRTLFKTRLKSCRERRDVPQSRLSAFRAAQGEKACAQSRPVRAPYGSLMR